MITSEWTIKFFTCSNYERWSKLTIKASEQRQHCYLGTDSNVHLAYPLQN